MLEDARAESEHFTGHQKRCKHPQEAYDVDEDGAVLLLSSDEGEELFQELPSCPVCKCCLERSKRRGLLWH